MLFRHGISAPLTHAEIVTVAAAGSVMHLRDFEGKSYKEIATILSITEEQVKINIFRARQTVKSRFLQSEAFGI